MPGQLVTCAPDGLSGGVPTVARRRAPDSASRRRKAGLTSLVLDQIPLAIAVLDDQARMHYWNMRAAGLLGAPALVASDRPALCDMLANADGLSPRQREQIVEFCGQQIASGFEADPDTLLRISLGRGHSLLIQVRGLGDGQWMLVMDDRRSARFKQGSSDAWLDALTGLSNRRHFNHALEDAVGLAGPGNRLALVMIDLDRFKAVNDTLGHPVGDALLCLVAQRLRREVRDDDILARLGGDEFIVLARHNNNAEALATRVVDNLSRPFLVEGSIVNIGASIGIAYNTVDGTTADDLMRHADLALYEAKASGRGTWRVFQPTMAAEAQARRGLETDLRSALALGELSLAYQPQMNVLAGTLTGFEALLRWDHPVRGRIPPGVFIPIAEDIGCIIALGEWVLRTACLEAARWPGSMSVAVNVSPRQFEDSDRFLNAVDTALAASGLPAERLELEITESSVLIGEARLLDILHRLRAMGIRIAMDDFGTGYSSLSQLRTFPFTKIKIDRAFIATLGHDADSNAVIRAITMLGAGLGMTTIAEGVETMEQAAMVEADGCTDIQGNLLSHPIPASGIDALLARHGPNRTGNV